jgi:hypothetical protein
MTVNDINDMDKNKQKQSKFKLTFIQNLTDIIACGTCGVQSGTGTGSLQVTILIPTAPHPSEKLNSVAVVRKQTIPTERPSLVCEVSVNLCG